MYKIFADDVLICDSRLDELVVINPEVNLEANAAGSFTFTIPAGHPFYDKIKSRQTVVKVYLDDDKILTFKGQCTVTNVDFYGQKSIFCEGELSYLNNSVLRPHYYKEYNPLTLLTAYVTEHNNQVDESQQFRIGTVTVTDPNNYISCYTNMNDTMTEIKEDLVDDLGGYMNVRYDEDENRYIDYISEPTKISGQTIELGKNLVDYKSNLDMTDIATVIIPLGALEEAGTKVENLQTRVTIESVNGGLDYIEDSEMVARFGRITKVVTWDNVSDPAVLKRKGLAYLHDTQFENVVIEVSAVDLGMLIDNVDRFELLNSVHVISPAHGMDRWFPITKIPMKLNNPETMRLTLGKSVQKSLSEQMVKTNTSVMKKIEKMPDNSLMQQAIDQATALITGGEGGYVLIDKDENGRPFRILVMDNDNKEQAENVIQINRNGIGFSTSGINGPYYNAWTIDGNLLADFITGGVLRSSSFIQEATITKYATDYSQADIDRMHNIQIGKITPTNADMEKYDINGDGRISVADVVIVNRMVSGTDKERSYNTYIKISPMTSGNILQTEGVVIGRLGMYSRTFTSDDIQSKKYSAYDAANNFYIDGVSGSFTVNGKEIRVTNGIITYITP